MKKSDQQQDRVWHDYKRLFKYRRSVRRAAVSRDLAEEYREQTNKILRRYPEPEPMPAGEWTKEVIQHFGTEIKGKLMYRIADAKALIDVIGA